MWATCPTQCPRLSKSIADMANGGLQLEGRHVLVTGAAGGIGGALCALMAERGAKVCGLDRADDRLGKLAEDNPGIGTVLADLTDAQEIAQRLDDYQAEHGKFDSLINNAALNHDIGTLRRMTPEVWSTEINANLNGVYNVTNALLTVLAQKGGSIVTISSVNALTSLGHPAYSAAKAGIVSYARAVAMEYGSDGVRSNVILPGTVTTRSWRNRVAKEPEIFTKLARWYPLGRVVDPKDVAKAACFLLSDDAAAISGAVLNVDCGLMAGILPFAEQLTLEKMS